MKIPYFEKRYTTTRIDPISPTLGNAERKSMETLSQGLSGIGSGSSSPAGFARSVLVCQLRMDPQLLMPLGLYPDPEGLK